MIEQTYTHTSKSDLLKDTPVVFHGRIINTDNEEKLNQLLLKPFAKRIYKLGICSDTRNCHEGKSKCLRCDYLIPNIDDLDYYRFELEDWTKKRELSDKIGNSNFSELCTDWIESYDLIIQKTLRAITNENINISPTSNGKETS